MVSQLFQVAQEILLYQVRLTIGQASLEIHEAEKNVFVVLVGVIQFLSAQFLARFWLSRVLDVAVVTSRQLSATPGLTGHRWTSLLIMTQIFELSNSKPSSNIVTQLIMKIKARISSSQQKQYPVKIPVQRSQSIYLNPSAGGLCQNCSYKLRTECRAHNKVIRSQVIILAPQSIKT